jgi:hypothetical protein
MLMLLDGTWKLVYTSNSELLAIIALSRLPFVAVGDITQRIDSAANTVENRAALSVPLSRTALSTTASFEVRSPKRLQVRFEKGGIQVRLRLWRGGGPRVACVGACPGGSCAEGAHR